MHYENAPVVACAFCLRKFDGQNWVAHTIGVRAWMRAETTDVLQSYSKNDTMQVL